MIELYKQRLGFEDSEFFLIEHDDAFVAIVYKVLRANGENFILKIHKTDHHYWRELFFLKHFIDQIPVPRIIQTVDPDLGVYGAILMEYVPGIIVKPREITPSLAFEIGTLLAQIHLHRVTGYGDITSKNLHEEPRTHFSTKFLEHLRECEPVFSKKLLQQCELFLDEQGELFNDVDGPCIVHRDFRPGNIIVDKGKLRAIIDWSSGCAGFAEEDFCLWEHSLSLMNAESMDNFLQGYASIRQVPDYKKIMPLLRLSKALGTIGFLYKKSINSDNNLYAYNLHFVKNFFK